MKILIVGNGAFGKVGKNIYIPQDTGNFIYRLRSHSINPSIIQFASKININDSLLDFDLSKHSINYIEIKKGKLNLLKSIIKIIKSIFNNDLTYIFMPGTLGIIISFICIIFRKKFGLYVRGEFLKYKKLYKYILYRSLFVLTVSPKLKEEIKKDNMNTSLIKPMLDIDYSKLSYKAYKKSKKINILFVGRVEYRKGIFDLLEMSDVLDDKKIEYSIDIVGGGNLFENLKSEYKIKKKNTIKFHGLISDKGKLSQFYKNSDIFFFPSHDEGFPRVLYDAMANSLPIFTTMVGGIPGYMNESNCIEIPVKNGNGSAKVLLMNIENEKLLNKISYNSFLTGKKIFNGKLLSHEKILIKQINDNIT